MKQMQRRTGTMPLDKQRELAKLGMAASLGGLVLTAALGTSRNRPWHLASGVALLGFSLWHQGLYGSKNGS